MICDKCGKEAEVVLPFPFIIKVQGSPRADSRGYVQFYGCRECLAWDKRLNNYRKWKHHGIRTDNPLRFTRLAGKPGSGILRV